MKKINIVKKNREFSNIINTGKSYKNRYYVIYFTKNREDIHRFGIAVPTKTGNAVLRNRIKRQVKSIIDNFETKFKNYDYIILVRKNILELDFPKKKSELENLLVKVGEEI